MKLNAPTKVVFVISLVLVIVAALAALGIIGAAAGYATWIAVVGWVVLAAGCVLKGL